jgi:hypothetical protein
MIAGNNFAYMDSFTGNAGYASRTARAQRVAVRAALRA